MRFLLTIFCTFSLMACNVENISNVADDILSTSLTNDDIIEGLKEALRVGTDSSISVLGVTNGYFADQAVKILLPPEANKILEYKDNEVFKALKLDEKFDDLVLGVNRAAEFAVDSTGPIFYSAIFDSMTITDGLTILNGSDTSATHYLKKNTQTSLTKLFYPYMDNALSTDFALGFTPKNLWSDLSTKFNELATTANKAILASNALGLTNKATYDLIENTDLTSWVTTKGLDGVFLKIGEQEALIRHDPIARVTDILKDVFGSVADKTASN